MKFEDFLQESALCDIPKRTVVGIDIGSRQAKAVLLHNQEFYTTLIPTGFVMKQTAEELLNNLFDESGLTKKDIEYIVVTGYGRVNLSFDFAPYRPVTEIACHGMGAHFIGNDVRTIIDIGGQDSKAIKIDPKDGKVIDFAMNDKCAAGTGRFLEKIANVLGYDEEEIGPASLTANKVSPINSTCVVFAESEVVAARAKGETAENLAYGIHTSVAKRVNGLLSKVGIESNVLFTGGVSNNIGMKKAFEELLGIKIAESKLDTVFAGALGAAIYAADYAENGLPSLEYTSNEKTFELDMTSFNRAVEKAHEEFVNHSTDTKAYVAYTCAYTPIEVLAAANVSYIRLLHRGTPDEVIAGETLTQSMLCDFTKSVVGGFVKNTPEFKAIDKLYTFYTCSCMRNTLEAIGQRYVPTTIFNVPRKKQDVNSKEFLAVEIKAFKKDLEKLTGEVISDDLIRQKTILYNKAKRLIFDIAEYRKGDYPLLSSRNFQDIVKGFYTLPIDVLLVELQKLTQQLKMARKPTKGKKLKIMISGGIIANGDNKITGILENDLGATIVVEDNCTGIKPLSFQVETGDGHIFDNLSEAYLGKAPCARMYPLDDMVKYSVDRAIEYGVDGVVLYYLKFCPCYSMTEKVYRDAFEKAGIPIYITSGDYSVGDEGQFKTRLEAFIEMLAEKKDSRRLKDVI